VLADAGDEQVGPAVVVVIAEGSADADAIANGDAGFRCDLLEGAVALVAIQRVGAELVGEIDVVVTVAIEVGEDTYRTAEHGMSADDPAVYLLFKSRGGFLVGDRKPGARLSEISDHSVRAGYPGYVDQQAQVQARRASGGAAQVLDALLHLVHAERVHVHPGDPARVAHGGTVVGEEYLPMDASDWTSVLSKLRAAHPDALISSTAGGAPNVTLTKQLRASGMDVLFGNLGVDRVEFTMGRDLVLRPKTSNPINFFIYPRAESNGKEIGTSAVTLEVHDVNGGGPSVTSAAANRTSTLSSELTSSSNFFSNERLRSSIADTTPASRTCASASSSAR